LLGLFVPEHPAMPDKRAVADQAMRQRRLMDRSGSRPWGVESFLDIIATSMRVKSASR
jgi:hypothetical protein